MGTFLPLLFSIWGLSFERKDNVDHYPESVWEFLCLYFRGFPFLPLSWFGWEWEETTWRISSSQTSQSLLPFPAIPKALGFILRMSSTAWADPSRHYWFSSFHFFSTCPGALVQHSKSANKWQGLCCGLHDLPNHFRPNTHQTCREIPLPRAQICKGTSLI